VSSGYVIHLPASHSTTDEAGPFSPLGR
jgi:hypothetical protein